jgi:glycosyl transferase family 25
MTKKRLWKDLWDFFDGHIRCINLKSRPDRYKSSKKIFDRYHIPANYYLTTKHPNGGEQGCFESHIDIIREAYDDGAERVLIFEDDITETDHMNRKNLERAIDFMEREDDWDLFYLGALPNIKSHSCSRTQYSGIYKLKGICTHAYIVNRKAMRKLINLEYRGVPIDYYFMNKFKKSSYALYPTLFHQGLSSSDIVSSGNWWDSYATETSVKYFYRCVEFHAYYINYPLVVLVPLLLIVLAWLVTGMYNRYHPLAIFSLVVSLLLFATFTID